MYVYVCMSATVSQKKKKKKKKKIYLRVTTMSSKPDADGLLLLMGGRAVGLSVSSGDVNGASFDGLNRIRVSVKQAYFVRRSGPAAAAAAAAAAVIASSSVPVAAADRVCSGCGSMLASRIPRF